MSHIIYFFALVIFTSGLFIMLINDNYFRKIIGLGILQSSVLIFYLALGKVNGGVVPIEHIDSVVNEFQTENVPIIIQHKKYIYTSPLPHVLMLTSIVVGFATLSVGLALIYRITKQFGTISESEINFSDNEEI